MAEVDDRKNIPGLQVSEGLIGEGPVVVSVAQPGLVNWRPVAEKAKTQFLEQFEVGAPLLVEATFLHFVDPLPSSPDRGSAVFNAGSKDEIEHEGT